MTDDENGEEGMDDPNAEGEDPNAMGDDANGMGTEDPNSLKSLEKDMFADLTPEQLNIKNSELLGNYVELYDSLETIFDHINKIPKTFTNTRIIEYIADRIMELRDRVNIIITTSYTTKTYLENDTIYKECLLELHRLNKMLKMIVPSVSKSTS